MYRLQVLGDSQATRGRATGGQRFIRALRRRSKTSSRAGGAPDKALGI